MQTNKALELIWAERILSAAKVVTTSTCPCICMSRISSVRRLVAKIAYQIVPSSMSMFDSSKIKLRWKR